MDRGAWRGTVHHIIYISFIWQADGVHLDHTREVYNFVPPFYFFFFLMQNLNTVLWKSTRKGEMGPDEGALFPSGTQRQLLFLKKYIFCLFIYLSVPGSSYAIPNTEKVERLWGQHYTSLKNRQRSWHPVLSPHGKSMGEKWKRC